MNHYDTELVSKAIAMLDNTIEELLDLEWADHLREQLHGVAAFLETGHLEGNDETTD